MPSEILKGDVFQRDAAGKWRLVLTASGVSVVDGFKVPYNWREQVREKNPRPRFSRLQQSASTLYVNDVDMSNFLAHGSQA